MVPKHSAFASPPWTMSLLSESATVPSTTGVEKLRPPSVERVYIGSTMGLPFFLSMLLPG
jgi:hypothetical protein